MPGPASARMCGLALKTSAGEARTADARVGEALAQVGLAEFAVLPCELPAA